MVRIFSRLAGRGLKVSNVVQNEAERAAKAADESSLLTGKQPSTPFTRFRLHSFILLSTPFTLLSTPFPLLSIHLPC